MAMHFGMYFTHKNHHYHNGSGGGVYESAQISVTKVYRAMAISGTRGGSSHLSRKSC